MKIAMKKLGALIKTAVDTSRHFESPLDIEELLGKCSVYVTDVDRDNIVEEEETDNSDDAESGDVVCFPNLMDLDVKHNTENYCYCMMGRIMD